MWFSMTPRSRAPFIVYLILLIVIALSGAQVFAQPVESSWAVQGTVTVSTYPCYPANSTCQVYSLNGIGGLSCAFPNVNLPYLVSCTPPVYYGSWRLVFACYYPATSCTPPSPPSQGQEITAYGTLVQPSSLGGGYQGDLYVTGWYAVTYPSTFNGAVASYGDQNVEQWSSTIGANVVQAYLMFTVPGPVAIHSVSMYTQYSGSDGTQCMRFGIYADNGNGSPAGQPLVAATRNTYCLRGAGTWGPAWETWNLRYDTLIIPAAGTYWLAVLAPQQYGSIYHYAYSGSYDYTYGYSTYFFAAPYSQGFPQIFSATPASEGNGPYSIYVTATSPT
jgi:hypothetical protein